MTVATKGSGNPQRDLNHTTPAANTVRLGDLLNDIITSHNALLAALQAASGGNVPVLTSVNAVRTLATQPVAPEITGDRP